MKWQFLREVPFALIKQPPANDPTFVNFRLLSTKLILILENFLHTSRSYENILSSKKKDVCNGKKYWKENL